MVLKLNTAPTTEPITLIEAKTHMRIDADLTDDDDLIVRNIKTVRRQVEYELNRALITQTWEYYLDEWPSEDFIRIPLPPLISITSVAYTDSDGVSYTFTDYIADTVQEPGRVVLKDGYSWPGDRLYPVNPIKITYVCGYGAATAVPESIKDAMLIRLTDMYENKGEKVLGISVSEIDDFSDGLLTNYRIWP